VLSYPPTRPPPTSALFPYTTLFRSLLKRPTAHVRDGVVRQRARVERPEGVFGRASPHTAERCRRHLANAPIFRVEVPHGGHAFRSEEHTSELQSLTNLVCRLLLEKK